MLTLFLFIFIHFLDSTGLLLSQTLGVVAPPGYAAPVAAPVATFNLIQFSPVAAPIDHLL